jgi:hypothetical protein
MTKKPKVAYFLGAGASFNSMPLVKTMPESMKTHVQDILSFRSDPNVNSTELNYGVKLTEAIDRYTAAMMALVEHAKAHESVDTYAKKLFLTGKSREGMLLKILLTTYFSHLQRPSAKIDARYDGLLASILTHGQVGGPQINKEVMMLNWNYDLQLPLAFRPYYIDDRIESLLDGLHLTTLDQLDAYQQIPGVVHLNGLATWQPRSSMAPIIPDGCIDELEVVRHLMQHFLYGVREYNPSPRLSMLRFAWENDPSTEAGILKLKKHLSECEVLVVIGYSFPFFNRGVDRAIIGGMPQLRKVYLQSTNSGLKSMVSAFKAIQLLDVEIETYDAVDKFMLPPEL